MDNKKRSEIFGSPPSRAAWIEMINIEDFINASLGRRLHGRRGLKYGKHFLYEFAQESPPSRAAWIEMSELKAALGVMQVAAFTGGVD